MSWLWSSTPPENETDPSTSTVDPYAPPSFDTSFDTSTNASTSDDAFGSAFTDESDITPSEQSTPSTTSDSFLTSSSSTSPINYSSSSSLPSPDSFSTNNDNLTGSSVSPSIDFSSMGRIDPSVISSNPAFSQSPSIDYVFANDYNEMRKKSTGEQLTFLTGSSYFLGSIVGATIGLANALPESRGKPTRLRVNAALNAVAKRGTSLGNACGVLALAFSLSESAIYNYTLDETATNYAAAGAIAGALFKSTRGIRTAGIWGASGACLALATVYASRRGYYGRGLQGVL